jgi:transaldolase
VVPPVSLGSPYVSPPVGTLDDMGQIGMDIVENVVRVYDNYGLQTQIAVQGIQSPLHVLDAAMMGADVATLPFAVLDKLFDHPLTTRGLASLRTPSSDGPRRIH